MIIVSMTSFPGRIHLVPQAFSHFIENQTKKCDRYILWLSRAEFGGEKTPLELGLNHLVELSLEILWCNEDSKIHIRHNSCRLWPDAYNIMIDEDIYYPKTYVQELINASIKHPNCIISYFAGYEFFTGYGRKYNLPKIPWPSCRNKFNGGLVCFAPNTYPQVCFEFKKIRDEICPFHDETWVNLFASFLNIRIYGCHRINWKIFKYVQDKNSILHLHDKHGAKDSKYSFDAIQFNKVMFVFPELKKRYNQLHFGVYKFKDEDELQKYRKYSSVKHINTGL